ncbi:MAG: hypothetical protein ABW224_06035 [Kibdelosporangium sp.]
MALDRRKFLVGGAAVAAFATTAGRAEATTPDLWHEFAANPYDHPQIPNVTFAGYRLGSVRLVGRDGLTSLRYGTKPDG